LGRQRRARGRGRFGFSSTNLHLTNTNNLAAGTTFNSVTLSGSNYVMNANSVTLTAGSRIMARPHDQTASCPLSLPVIKHFSAQTNTTLILPVIGLGK